MSNASQVLSRFSFTAAGAVVYETGGIYFTATADGLHAAHVADVTVGIHPYALVTTCRDTAPLVSPSSERAAARIGASADVLADWSDWCDDVMEDVIADAAYEGLTETDVCAATATAAMAHTWEVPASAADIVAIVNAA